MPTRLSRAWQAEHAMNTTATKHGAANPAAPPPPSGDWTIDQGWAQYTPEQHAVWQTLYQRQCQLLPGRACDEFMQGLQALPISAHQIPRFDELNQVLMAATGWQVVAVPGLVPDEVFFNHLAHRRFPSGNFIRQAHELDYIEEPDVFHDVFGHVPMLMNPVIADFVQAYGQGGLRAQRLGQLPQLARVYWYTIEFGLVQQADGLRLFGAGIASSFTESQYALSSPLPHRLRFDLERVMRTRVHIDDLQQSYFVLNSLDELLALAKIDFAPRYARVAGLPEIEPSEFRLVAGDVVVPRT
jgi:phenylalanine-4-hydroxylase